MTFQMSGAQLLGFLTAIVMIGPALMAVGALWNRVRHLERSRENDEDTHQRMWKALDEIRNSLGYLKGLANGKGNRG